MRSPSGNTPPPRIPIGETAEVHLLLVEDDARVAAELGLTVEQERDVLARARAAVRDRLDDAAAAVDIGTVIEAKGRALV